MSGGSLRTVVALVAGVTLTCAPAAEAQRLDFSDRWRWVTFGVQSGLPSASITGIAQTPGGVVWVATSGGIAWYDGYRWHPIGPARTPSAYPARVVAGSTETVVAVVNGIALQGDTSALRRASPAGVGHVHSAVPFDGGAIMALLDSSGRRQLRILRDGVAEPFESPGELARELQDRDHLRRSPRGRIWVASAAGLFWWSGSEWVRGLDINGGALKAFAEDSAGRALAFFRHLGSVAGAGLWESDGGAFRLRRSEGRNAAIVVALGPNGEAIAAYETGDLRQRIGDRWEPIQPVPQEFREVTALHFGANGDLGVGSDAGLHLYRRASRRWNQVARPFPDEHNRINAIARARDGVLWLATGRGVWALGPNGSSRVFGNIGGLSDIPVTAVAEDGDGGIWVGSGSAFIGAFRWDGRSWRRYGAAEGLPTYVHRITRDRAGRLWFLGLGGADQGVPGGAYLLDGRRFVSWSGDNSHGAQRVYAMADGADGTLWFATSEGVQRWRDGTWTRWSHRRPEAGSRVFTLAMDAGGRVWFSDQVSGLGYLDDRDSIRYVTTADGLVDDRVYEVKAGPDGRLWVATSGGLGTYANGTWASFGPEEGLPSQYLWPLLPESTRVLIGSRGSGLLTLNLEEGRTPPRIAGLRASLTELGVDVAWQAHSFRSRQRPERIRTRYRVDGGEWSVWSRDRSVLLREPGRGRHRVEVQALGVFGDPGEVAVASFTIPTPLPLRPSFFIPVSLLVATVSFVGLRAMNRQRRVERELIALEEQLRQAQKMEALGQLAGGVAHDFNNILTAVMGHAELIAAELPAAMTTTREDVEQIRTTAQRGAAMIRKLLMFGQRGQLELQPLRLAEVASELSTMLGRLLPETVRLVLTREGDVVALADRSAIEQILVNLATNARDAMPEGGELHIRTIVRRVDAVRAARSGLAAAGDYGCIEVADTGIGMDEATQARIFEPFFTTKATGKGTGLGMAMVYSLVRRQKGGIEMRSSPGKGTRIRLLFPMADGQQGARVSGARRAVPEVEASGSILVVEDEPVVRAATSRVLAKEGFEVEVAEDGAEALLVLRERGATFDLVVSDVVMPRMSGYRLYEAAMKEGFTGRFVFTSGHAEAPDAGARPVGVPFLPKPWSAGDLLRIVREALERPA